MSYNIKQHLADNIEAIKVAFQLSKSKVHPSEQQVDILKKYSGFGGIKCIMYEPDTEKWPKQYKSLFPLIDELHSFLKQNCTTKKEYEQHIRSLRSSVLSSFYTPAPIVTSLIESFKKLNIIPQKILDPAAGQGIFASNFLTSLNAQEVHAFEKELVTGRILTTLHPAIHTNIKGFQEIDKKYNSYFDLIATNIPFGEYQVYDPLYNSSSIPAHKAALKAIHNYFFVKGIDCLRNGGILAYITTQFFLNSEKNKMIRAYLMEKANLLSAIRLPNNLFASANTKAGSDLIILQRQTDKTTLSKEEEKFINCEISNDITINSLFIDPERIISSAIFTSKDQYGKPGFEYFQEGGVPVIADKLKTTVTSQLEKHFNPDLYYQPEIFKEHQVLTLPDKSATEAPSPPQNISSPQPAISSTPAEQTSLSQNPSETNATVQLLELWDQETLKILEKPAEQIPEVKEIQRSSKKKRKKEPLPELPNLFSEVSENTNQPLEIKQNYDKKKFTEKALPFYTTGTLICSGGQAGFIMEEEDGLYFKPIRINFILYEMLFHYTEVRNLYLQLSNNENVFHEEDPTTRKKLNEAYDRFVKKFNNLNARWNVKSILMDVWGRDTLTLEKFKNGIKQKADIFNEPVAFTKILFIDTDNIKTALAASLNYFGKVNLDYISKIYHKPLDTIIQELKGKIYLNPETNEYETTERFLSGNILNKVRYTEAWLKKFPDNVNLKENLEALRSILPPQIPFDEIDFNFGERWIPCEIYSSFGKHLFKTDITIFYYDDTDLFTISADKENINITQKYAIKTDSGTYDGIRLFRHALLNTVPMLTKKIIIDGEETKVPDPGAIQLATTKIEEIRDEFSNWLSKQPEKTKASITDHFNNLFNSTIRPQYDGSDLQFPGLHLQELGYREIHKTQKDASWLLLSNEGGIIDHEVGLGKTLTMCLTCHEMKRLGIIHKPMLIVHSKNADEIARTYQTAYPNDKVFFYGQSTFTGEEKARICWEIKNNNWDAIVLTHDQFAKIPQSLKIQQEYVGEQLQGCVNNLRLIEERGGNIGSRLLKGLEIRIANLQAKLERINNRITNRYINIPDFQEMNIDHLFVDECQQFKNLGFDTRHNRVAGLGNKKGSQRALNLLYAIRTIQARKDKDFQVSLLTGTLISNSLVELYTWHYLLCPRALKKMGINCFDAWLAMFARKRLDYEFGVTNEIKLKERFREFIKINILSNFHYQFTDYKTGKDINLDRPEPVTKLITTDLTPQQQEFSKKLIEFAKTGDRRLLGGPPLTDNEKNAKMLIATDYSRKMALDMRLVNPSKYVDETNNKLSVCAKNIAEIYYQYDSVKGTQLVFCDLGTFDPSNPYKWNIYQELKRKLVEDYHLPPEEIRFAQEFKTDEQKRAAKKAFRTGKIRVYLGSSYWLGTGQNLQQNIVASHDLDIPWTHKDLVQRHGRSIRTGSIIAKQYAGNKVLLYIYATKNSLDIYRFTLLQNKEFISNQVRSGQCTTNRIDEGAIDSENGCSYAEFIAILSGNDSLLKKAKLEKEIAGLEREKYAFHRNQRIHRYRYADLKNEIEKLQNQISTYNNDYSRFQKALKYDENGKPIFIIKLNNIKSSDPEIIARELNHINQNFDSKGQTVEIGKIFSFSILVKTVLEYVGLTPILQNKFMVKGKTEIYTHNYGNLPVNPKLAFNSFYKALEVIPKTIEHLKTQKEKHENNLPVMEELATESWKKEEKLKNLKKQLSGIEREIDLSLKQIESIPQEKQSIPETQNSLIISQPIQSTSQKQRTGGNTPKHIK